MAGYDGYSMSNNAVVAYAGGEAPWSRTRTAVAGWIVRKPKIMTRIGVSSKKEVLEILAVGKDRKVFRKSSWHHTSKKYNCTDFFNLGEVYAKLIKEAGYLAEMRDLYKKNGWKI